MRELLEKLKTALESGEAAVLATIIAASGSTPRGTGARMLVTGAGRVAGTVGGGAVEYECEKKALKCLKEKQSDTESFTLTHNDIADIGMICGGDVRVEFRYIEAGDGIVDELEREYSEQRKKNGRVFVFGGGHVSQQLVPTLARVDFRCTVIEDRPEFTAPELFEGKAEDIRLINMPDVAKLVSEITEDDYICIMTRGHKDDYAVQAQMLKSKACYIGVIGSRHKIAGVNAKLRADGFTEDDIKRITTPIGLEIAAETPAEIAVSVAAQMIRVRAEKNGSRKLQNG